MPMKKIKLLFHQKEKMLLRLKELKKPKNRRNKKNM